MIRPKRGRNWPRLLGTVDVLAGLRDAVFRTLRPRRLEKPSDSSSNDSRRLEVALEMQLAGLTEIAVAFGAPARGGWSWD